MYNHIQQSVGLLPVPTDNGGKWLKAECNTLHKGQQILAEGHSGNDKVIAKRHRLQPRLEATLVNTIKKPSDSSKVKHNLQREQFVNEAIESLGALVKSRKQITVAIAD